MSTITQSKDRFLQIPFPPGISFSLFFYFEPVWRGK